MYIVRYCKALVVADISIGASSVGEFKLTFDIPLFSPTIGTAVLTFTCGGTAGVGKPLGAAGCVGAGTGAGAGIGAGAAAVELLAIVRLGLKTVNPCCGPLDCGGDTFEVGGETAGDAPDGPLYAWPVFV